MIIRNLPIRTKLIMIIMAATLSAIALLCAVFITYEYITYRETLQEEFTTTSKIIADRSTAALLFNNKQQIKENISSLRLHKMVQLACVYNDKNRLLAQFSPTHLPCPQKVNRYTHQFEDNYFHLTQPIMVDGQERGRIYIQVSLQNMHKHLGTYLFTTIAFALLATLVVFMLSSLLQRFISSPLLMLKYSVDRISQQNDYSLRVTKESHDEVGDLVDAVNSLVATIESQNRTITKYAEGLEDQVAFRTQALQIANQELEAFSYSVSHDLRAPLRAIDGFTQALEEDYGKVLDGTAHDYIKRVRSASLKMGTIITGLLQLSRISRRVLKEEKFNMAELCQRSLAQLRSNYPEREVTVDLMEDIPAKADPQLLAIALDNLIGNAWKFSKYISHAQISIGFFIEDGITVYYVKDNGAGYDARYAKNLFTAFQRLHSPNEFDGTGIGLANAARIVHRHKGEIWSESLVGEGASFYFTLHAKKPDHL